MKVMVKDNVMFVPFFVNFETDFDILKSFIAFLSHNHI